MRVRIIEHAVDAIVLPTLGQVIARVQALSRRLVDGRAGTSVADVLADRAAEAGSPWR